MLPTIKGLGGIPDNQGMNDDDKRVIRAELAPNYIKSLDIF
jgi:hypothetical protein